MIYLKTAYISAFSVTALFLLCKLMGKRQISQLSMFDYINGISIGSIAAEMATETDSDPFVFVVAMTVYALLSVLITWSSSKSIFLRKIFEGNSLLLYSNNILYRKNFARSKLDLNEFLSLLRIKGYYDLSKVATVVLETNGQLSIQPVSVEEPVSRKDAGIAAQKNCLLYNVILDGKLMAKSIINACITNDYIERELKKAGLSAPAVFLATYNAESKEIKFYPINNEYAQEITS